MRIKEHSLKIALVLLCSFNIGQGQPFFSVSGGVNKPVYSLFADTNSNLLYAGGQFTQAGGMLCNGIAKWDGLTWDSLDNDCVADARAINQLNNVLYAGGGFSFFDTASSQWIVSKLIRFDSITGSWLRIDTPRTNGWVWSILNDNNNLYITGQFDTIAGIYSTKIIRYDGLNWYPFPPLDTDPGWAINSAIFYNGELYVGGNFDSQLASNMKDIAKWDGTQWLPVCNGLSGFNTWVNDFAIYQGNLIVAGYFSTASGDPGNDIASWNGTQWTQLGSGITTGQIWDLEIYNNELWAGGSFLDAGGIPASRLAKWNGIQWDTLGVILDNAVGSFAVLGNDLYIGGGFWTMDGDTVNRIIRYNYLTGFDDMMPDENVFQIYPNPTNGNLNIESSYQDRIIQVTVFNVFGKKVKSFASGHSFSIAGLPQGVYLIKAEDETGKTGTAKVILY